MEERPFEFPIQLVSVRGYVMADDWNVDVALDVWISNNRIHKIYFCEALFCVVHLLFI